MPSRLLPIDADGTVVGQSVSSGGTINPVSSYPTAGVVVAWVNATTTAVNGGQTDNGHSNTVETFLFFPEQRTILGGIFSNQVDFSATVNLVDGSNDTTNGADGTWETASFPSGLPGSLGSTSTIWRTGVMPCTFTGAKQTVRLRSAASGGNVTGLGAIHLYGVKFAGQTPDDILFLDGDTTFAEYTVDKDFGDRPLGTTVVKQFKLKNSSATLTANTIVVTCNDADFAISNDGVTYGTTFTVTSLGAGVSSAVFYIRNTTPAPGAALGPRQVRLSAAVGSYT